MQNLISMPVATALLFGIALSALKTVSARLAFPMKLILDRKTGEQPPIWAGCELLAGVIAVLLLGLAAMYFLFAVLAALGAAPSEESKLAFDEAGSVVTTLGFGAAALHYVFSCVRWLIYPQTRSGGAGGTNA